MANGGDDQGGGADPSDPDAPRSGPISPDEESQFAFQRQQADTAQRTAAAAAFDTMRRQRAFTSAILSAASAKDKKGQADKASQALRVSALGQSLGGVAPGPQQN